MNNRVRRTSIIDRLTHTTRATAIMLAIPALLSLGMMLLTTVRYQRAMDRMATVAGLKPVVGTQLPEQLFSVTAGRLDYEASGVDALVGSVDQTLGRLLEDTEGRDLSVPARHHDTLR
ncbi:MAG: hypothetical protein ABS888_07185, partial [Eubacteriales bacterium]